LRCVPRLGVILVERGVLSPEHVTQVLELQGKSLQVWFACGKSFNIAGAAPDRSAPCPECGASLCSPRLSEIVQANLGAAKTQVLPAVRPEGSETEAHRAAQETAVREPAEGASPPTAPSPPFSGTPFGRYRLLERLGAGGMGVVWKAWDTDLARIVALKQIRAEEAGGHEAVARFLREARLAQGAAAPMAGVGRGGGGGEPAGGGHAGVADAAIDLGWSDRAHMERDSDLQALHADPRWAALPKDFSK